MSSDMIRGLVEDKQKAYGVSFDVAVQQTREFIVSFAPDKLPLLDEFTAEHQAKTEEAVRLSETSTAFIRSGMARQWYVPRVVPGGVWEGLRERMSNSSLASAVESIDESTDAIVSHLAEPNVSGDKRRGLVIGNVQSGKTANYAVVIAKALDEGYRFVIVMSGIHSNLRQQTQRRMERDLGTTEGRSDWFRLTSEAGDIGREYIKNASAVVGGDAKIIAVVKKNSRRLENLYDFLRAVDPATKARTPILIIDDESDQATPDSSGDSADSPTAINRWMRKIWGEVENGTYAGYTATPFANVFIHPDNEEDLYPADFLNVMPTPSNYFGAEALFGLEDVDGRTPDVIRRIDKAELASLMPRSQKAMAEFEPEVTESLADAVRWFIVAAAVRRLRGQAGKHSTMLVHTTHYVEPHRRMSEALNAYLQPLKDRALDGDVDGFHAVFKAEMNRAAELYTGDGPAPTWPAVQAEIPNVLRTLRIAVDNGSAEPEERLNYTDGTPQTVIVIGGGTLSRGLTLEGLFVSFFTRTSSAYDTLLQMGRWFGYREGYEDLQRIWVSSGLDSDYSFLATVEADLRVEIERLAAAGQTPREIGVRVRQHPGRLEITSKNKMKHVETVEVDFEGYRLQTVKFDVSEPQVLVANAAEVSGLLSGAAPFTDSGTRRSGGVLYADVPSEPVLHFLSNFAVHPNYQNLVDGAVRWTREKLPERSWNVVLASGSVDEEFSVGDVSVHAVNRAPIADRDPDDASTVNIRALMSGGDLSLDLVLSGRASASESATMKNDAQMARRAEPYGAQGKGLLVIYPISRRSVAQDGSRVRRPMESALREINPALVDDGLPPLFGIGFVTPFDVDDKLRAKGTFVAVRPSHVDDSADDEIVEPPVEDTERDFAGDR